MVGFRPIPLVARIPPVAPPQDPDGIDAPLLLMGGRVFHGHVGSSPIYGGIPQQFSFASTPSTAEQWHAVAFLGIHGGLPPAVPTFIHGPVQTFPSDGGFVRPSDGGFPHAPASVASTLALAAPPLRPLSHENLSGFASSDLTMSAWPSTPVGASPGVATVAPGVTVPVATVPPASGFASVPHPTPFPAASPDVTVAPNATVLVVTVLPASNLASGPHPTPLPAAFPGAMVPAPSLIPAGAGLVLPVIYDAHLDDALTVENVAPSPAPFPALRSMEPFKLPPIADSKAFLNLSSILQ